MTFGDVLHLLKTDDATEVEELYSRANKETQRVMGSTIHLRGLVEVSNHCRCLCSYCGINAKNSELRRYRMTSDDIMASARAAYDCGCNTIVMQGGEDIGLTEDMVSDIVKRIKSELPVAVSLSLGERPTSTLKAWRNAGADRYLMRFEIGDPDIYKKLHPHSLGGLAYRIDQLKTLKSLGFETGSGVLLGLPGQTHEQLAKDIMTFKELDLDMIGVGPFINHPATPLWNMASSEVPATAEMAYRVNSLIRLLSPGINVPSTTATATLDGDGYLNGLQRGANVVMFNFTPTDYRKLYEIYPAKACIKQKVITKDSIREWLATIGRVPGNDQGFRIV
jgi:biotin synthase